jgi:transposase
MEAYSKDLRKRMLADCDAGMRTKQVAEKCQVSRPWVRRIKQQRRETGQIAALPFNGGRKPIIDRIHLADLVKQTPDATLAELRDKLGLRCSLSAIHQALARLKITFKKR